MAFEAQSNWAQSDCGYASCDSPQIGGSPQRALSHASADHHANDDEDGWKSDTRSLPDLLGSDIGSEASDSWRSAICIDEVEDGLEDRLEAQELGADSDSVGQHGAIVVRDGGAHLDDSGNENDALGLVQVVQPRSENYLVDAALQCYRALPAWPADCKQELQLVLQHSMAAEAPPFCIDHDHGKSSEYVFNRLESDQVLRSHTWKAQAVSAGLANQSSAAQTLQDRFTEVAELVYISSRVMWASFFCSLVRSIRLGHAVGILLAFFGISDEASFKLRMPQPQPLRATPLLQLEGPQPIAKRQRRAENTDAKVMQSELRISVLWRNTSSKQLQIMTGPLPTHLQAMDRTTAENLVPIQAELYNLPGISDDDIMQCFKMRLKTHTQDACNSNEKQINVARASEKDKQVKVSRLALHCDQHRIATIHTRCYDLVSWHISGMLAVAISERGPGKVDELRTVAGEYFVDILKIERHPLEHGAWSVEHACTTEHGSWSTEPSLEHGAWSTESRAQSTERACRTEHGVRTACCMERQHRAWNTKHRAWSTEQGVQSKEQHQIAPPINYIYFLDLMLQGLMGNDRGRLEYRVGSIVVNII